MPDISMCSNPTCPNAGTCKRVQSKPDKWQSFMCFSYTVGENGVICEDYIPTRKTSASDKSECTGSVCSNCRFWEGIDELGSFIEGTCTAMLRVTGYAETCDEFTPNEKDQRQERR